jgi:hypothetical protein
MEQFFSTLHGKPILSGWPSFYPPALQYTQWLLRDFPDSRSVTVLRALGFRLAVVHPARWGIERRGFERRLAARPDVLPLLARFPARDLEFWTRFGFGGEEVHAILPLAGEERPRECHCREIDRRGLRATASSGRAELALDGLPATRWTTGAPQQSGDTFELWFDRPRIPVRLEVDVASASSEFARDLRLAGRAGEREVRVDVVPDVWQQVAQVRQLVGDPPRARLDYDLGSAEPVDRLRLVLGSAEEGLPPWSIPEIHVFEAADGPDAR